MAFVKNGNDLFWLLCVFLYGIKTVISIKQNSNEHVGGSRVNVTHSHDMMGYRKQQVDIFPILKAFHDLETYIFENLDRQKNDRDISDGSLAIVLLNNLNKIRFQNSSTCANDTERLVVGFLGMEIWAVQFFDASGKPGPSLTQGWLNFVGNYDQCQSATAPSELSPMDRQFRGGYFQVALRSTTIPTPIQIGVCLPDTCSGDEIKSLATQVLQAANLSMSVQFVHHLTGHTEVTSATIAAIFVSCCIGLMMILGTSYDLVFVQFPLWYEENKDNYKKPGPSLDNPTEGTALLNDMNSPGTGERSSCSTDINRKTDHLNSIKAKILMAFSVYSNAKKVLNISQSSGSIQSIHGIRFFSISWVVMAHTYAFTPSYAINIANSYSIFLNRWTFDVIANSFVCVDTFFTLSGLLTSYMTIEHITKKGLKFNWLLFYFHRFWRVTPPYMFVIILYLGFQQYFIEGPLRNFEQPIDKSACENHWWTNLLYINNLIHTRQGEICLGHSWYLSNDMQFFILSPLMMLPFYFHRLAGLFSCFLFLLATWITSGVLSTVEEWPPTAPNLKQQLRGKQNDGWLNDYSVKPWCRIGPFVVGIVAGYILSLYKERQLYLRRWVVVLGWITAAISATAVLYGLRGNITGDDPSPIGASALYNSVARSVWGLCVSWVIIACTAGYGGPVNLLLSWSPFVVLGRMSYMVYLIHVPIIFIFYQNLDQLFYINDTTMCVYFLGLLVASNLVAFVFMLGLESPMIGLEKAILKRENK